MAWHRRVPWYIYPGNLVEVSVLILAWIFPVSREAELHRRTENNRPCLNCSNIPHPKKCILSTSGPTNSFFEYEDVEYTGTGNQVRVPIYEQCGGPGKLARLEQSHGLRVKRKSRPSHHLGRARCTAEHTIALLS